MTIEAIIWARRVTETGVLKTGQAFVLMLLGDHADESWSCFLSQELLARGTAQSVRSVQRQIDQLEQLGLISVKAVYGGSGREGRTGSRYQLHPEALEGIVGGGAETRMSSRPDNLSPNSETRMDSRPDNLSPNSELGDNLTDLGDNRDFADYKDRARTNPQEPSSVRPSVRQSGAVRVETTTDDGRRTDQVIDGGEGVGLVHRGVVLADLVQRVPAAADLGDGQLRSIVDVVLARASGPVRKPTAFVARSLASEFEELVAVTRPRPVAVAQGPAASGQVRELRTGEPCQDPDVHVPAYGQAVLADCPHCRLERRAMPRGLVEAVE
ncbi:helix-turn-helix domain-containing protein [Micrococcus luteus]|uniref:helix-turn-helix domain-containing protein n=1 Tax=Micrococcus luteus TaxID=1270 RepID=UPI0019D16410|nr:helix-turn-helix domain-containing protein [Micrococcus luteus]MBN6750507.1 helix-turn-helix domain-containing protein [Micrococcus luteus]MBN6760367.1 helix-turn-helix domain-containing protein [Micrococcus luteus]MBN6802089.1 helix-turn-helix domain-containing protein [Micrococcus luteus]